MDPITLSTLGIAGATTVVVLLRKLKFCKVNKAKGIDIQFENTSKQEQDYMLKILDNLTQFVKEESPRKSPIIQPPPPKPKRRLFNSQKSKNNNKHSPKPKPIAIMPSDDVNEEIDMDDYKLQSIEEE